MLPSSQIPLLAAVVALGTWSSAVHATPPLLTAAELVGVELEVYVRPGALTLTQPTDDGTRVALRPLVSNTPGALPPDLPAWTHLTVGQCAEPPSFRWTRAGKPAVARAVGTPEQPGVEIQLDGTVVALGGVGRPAWICALHVLDVDDIPGEEVVVLWQTGKPGEPRGPNTTGVSILRIPETAQ